MLEGSISSYFCPNCQSVEVLSLAILTNGKFQGLEQHILASFSLAYEIAWSRCRRPQEITQGSQCDDERNIRVDLSNLIVFQHTSELYDD